MKRWAPALLGLAALAAGGASGCAGPRTPPPAIETSRLVVVGSVRVDPVSRAVVATGFVNQVSGAIELMICGPGGKRHESAFVMEAEPVDLQTALLLLGLKAGPVMPDLGQGPPRGSPVDIWVQWRDARGLRSEPAERFAWNWKKRRTVEPRGWIFTGSMFVDGRFKAEAEESLAASYWDPWAILNLNAPEGGDDEALSVNTNLVPALHTPVTFLMRARP